MRGSSLPLCSPSSSSKPTAVVQIGSAWKSSGYHHHDNDDEGAEHAHTAISNNNAKGEEEADLSRSPAIIIKRPMNSFMVYAKIERMKLRAEDPGRHNAEITVELAQQWRGMSKAEKQPFRDEASRLRDQHKTLYPNYKYKPRRKKKSPAIKRAAPTRNYPEKKAAPNKGKKRATVRQTSVETQSISGASNSDPAEEPWYENYDFDTQSDLYIGEPQSAPRTHSSRTNRTIHSPLPRISTMLPTRHPYTFASSSARYQAHRGAESTLTMFGHIIGSPLHTDGEFHITTVERFCDIPADFGMNTPLLRDVGLPDFAST